MQLALERVTGTWASYWHLSELLALERVTGTWASYWRSSE